VLRANTSPNETPTSVVPGVYIFYIVTNIEQNTDCFGDIEAISSDRPVQRLKLTLV
jgi:hypothetical protein